MINNYHFMTNEHDEMLDEEIQDEEQGDDELQTLKSQIEELNKKLGIVTRENTKLKKGTGDLKETKPEPIQVPTMDIEKIANIELRLALQDAGLDMTVADEAKRLGGIDALSDKTIVNVLKAKMEEKKVEKAAASKQTSRGKMQIEYTDQEIKKMSAEEYAEKVLAKKGLV